MAVTAAVTGYNTLLKKASTAIAEVRKLSSIGPDRSRLEATNLSSPNTAKEFIMGIIDSKEFTAEINYLPTDATHKALLTDLAAGTFASYSITLANGTSIWTVQAAPAAFNIGDLQPDGVMEATVTFRTTGAWTFPSA